MDTESGIRQLSERELEILALVARGETNADIAESLGLRFDTVKWYVSQILSKLCVSSREEAADAWRNSVRPHAKAGRWLRSLLTLPLFKAGLGAAGASAAGGVVLIAGLAADGRPPSAPTASTPAAAPTVPWPSPVDHREGMMPVGPFVDITSVTSAGKTHTLGMYEARFGLCAYTWDSDQGPPGGANGWMCAGPVTEPHLLSAHGTGRPAILEGIVRPEIVRVRVNLHEGPPVELATVPAPPALDVPWRFWIAAVARVELVASVDGFDALGNLVETAPLYQSPASAARSVPLPGPEQVNFGVSGRDDPSMGTVGMGTGARSFSVEGFAGELRFASEHDGDEAPRIVLWCQTGIVPISWEPGATANGNGTFVASIPAGNTACHWEPRSDGNLRIFAQAR